MQARFTIENRKSSITGDVPDELIDEATSYYVKGYQFTVAFKKRRWDGRVHLYHAPSRAVPTGLVSMLTRMLRRAGWEVEVEDARMRPHVWGIPIDLTGVELYPYQLEAAERAVTCERGVLDMATNAGKTEIAAAIIQKLGCRTLFLNHTRALMYQSRDRLAERLGVEVGIVGDGKWEVHDVTVCSLKTLYTRIKTEEVGQLLNDSPVIFSDECHRVGHNKWYDVLMKSDAYFRFGMSGTPFKRDDGASLMLRAATGGSIYKVSNRELVESGYSVPATVHLFKVRTPESLPFDKIHWREAYNRGIVRNARRNALICAMAADPVAFGLQAGQVLVIVKEIEHGFRLLDRAWKLGLRQTADFVYGEEDADAQLAKLERFKRGELRVLFSSTIADEGLDIPAIRVGINAAGGKSSIRTLQRIGRGLRKDAGKPRLDWVDFIDYANRYLLEHSAQRLADYEGEDAFEMEVHDG